MKSTEISVLELLPLLESHDVVMKVSGASMVPAIVRGDRLHLRRPSAGSGEPRVGQVVLCRDVRGKHVVHRVVATAPRLCTRGDALEQDDPPVAEVFGVVTRIEKTWRSRARRLMLFLRGRY